MMKNKIKNIDLSDIDSIDVRKYLADKGIIFEETSGGWLKTNCLFPDHDDSTPSFFIHPDHKGYNCYSCGRGGKLSELFEELGWEVKETPILVNVCSSDAWKKFKEKRQKKFNRKFLPPGDFKLIRANNKECSKHYSYLKKRNIENCAEVFKIGYSESDLNYKNRILIPVHNPGGKYYFTEGRAIIKTKNKKYYRPSGVSKDGILFNYHRIRNKKWVVVVEGIIDTITLHKWNIPSVCSFGAGLTDGQIILLMNFNDIFLCFDIDEAGIKAFVNVKEKLMGLGTNIYRIKLPRGKDANSVSKKIFVKHFKKAKKVY